MRHPQDSRTAPGGDDHRLADVDADGTKLKALAAQCPGAKPVSADIAEAWSRQADYVVLLAVKPQQLGAVLPGTGRSPDSRPSALFPSWRAIDGAHNCANLSGGTCPVVRVMPNTPALVGAGLSWPYAWKTPNLDRAAETFRGPEHARSRAGQVHELPEKALRRLHRRGWHPARPTCSTSWKPAWRPPSPWGCPGTPPRIS